jgi:hypothetical protein
LKKFETALIDYSGAWGKLIYEKTLTRKSRGIVPFMKKRRRKKLIYFAIVAGVDTANENSSHGFSVLLSGNIEIMDYFDCGGSVQLYLFT